MKTHKSVKEREAGRIQWDAKNEPNLSHKQTQAHKVSEKKGGHISFSPANVIYVGVCVSGCVMPDNRFTLMPTTFWNSWELSLLVQYHMCSSWGAASTSVSRTVSQTRRLHTGVEHRDRYWSTVYKGNSTCTGHVCIHILLFALHGAALLRKAFCWLYRLFCSSLVTVTDVYLQKGTDNNKEKWITAQVRLYLTWNNVSLRVRTCFFIIILMPPINEVQLFNHFSLHLKC